MRIAFSGSGLLFPAHFGAFISLRELTNEKLSAVAGTSGGSLIAAALACHSFADVNSILYDLDFSDYFEFNPTALLKKGICLGKKLEADLEYVFGGLTFEDTNLPLYVTASDMVSGNPFVFSKETTPDCLIRTALRASIAVPVVLTPVHYNGMILVDGSVQVPTPITCFPRSDERTFGIRLKGKQNSNYSGFNYFTKVLFMALGAVDNAHVEMDKLDDNMEMFFLDMDSYIYESIDTNTLINDGLYAIREQFLNRLTP